MLLVSICFSLLFIEFHLIAHFAETVSYGCQKGKILIRSIECPAFKANARRDLPSYICCPASSLCKHNEEYVRADKCSTKKGAYKSRRRAAWTNVCCPKTAPIPLDWTKCGVAPTKISYRVSVGKSVEGNKYPWMALLLYTNESFKPSIINTDLVPQCGGFLIHPRHVITAAHCVWTTPHNGWKTTLKSVRLGAHRPQYLDVEVKEALVHDKYRATRRYENDISLLRLKDKVSYSFNIQPICVPKQNINLMNSKLEIAGWGIMSNGSTSTGLLWNTVEQIPQSTCFAKSPYDFVQKTQICALGKNGIEPCDGDSGGPLMVTQGNEGRVYAAGIVSYGKQKCGQVGEPTYFTNTAMFYKWITDKIREMEKKYAGK